MDSIEELDLDYDTNLGGDASSFGIESTLELPPVADLKEGEGEGESDVGLTSLELAVALAMEACQWELAFYAWCDSYLYGEREAAVLDIPLVREVLKCERNYWGPCYFLRNTVEAKGKYYAIMAAQAALSAVQKRNKTLLIQKVIYYTGMSEKAGGI